MDKAILNLKSQEGSSIVGVIIALGIIGVVFSGMLKSHLNRANTSKHLTSKNSYMAINDYWIQLIAKNMDDLVLSGNDDVLEPAKVFKNISLGASTTLDFSNDLNIPNSIGNSRIVASARRCQTPRLPPAIDSGNTYYFCLKLDNSDSTLKGVLGSEVAFGEVSVELFDLHQNQPINIETYRSLRAQNAIDGSRNGGLSIVSTLYWSKKIGRKLKHDFKVLSGVRSFP